MKTLSEKPEVFTQMWSNLFVGDDVKVKDGMSYMHEDVTVFLASNPYRLDRFTDTEEIDFSHNKEGVRLNFFQVLEPKVQRFGDIAVVSYYARYSLGKDNSSELKFNKETLVLKMDNGSWKIVHMHNSI